jgi:hypothetical protein
MIFPSVAFSAKYDAVPASGIRPMTPPIWRRRCAVFLRRAQLANEHSATGRCQNRKRRRRAFQHHQSGDIQQDGRRRARRHHHQLVANEVAQSAYRRQICACLVWSILITFKNEQLPTMMDLRLAWHVDLHLG